MAMNELRQLRDALVLSRNEVHIEPELGARAMIPLQRMLDFSA